MKVERAYTTSHNSYQLIQIENELSTYYGYITNCNNTYYLFGNRKLIGFIIVPNIYICPR